MNQPSPLFLPEEFFLTRIPLYSLDSFFWLSNQNDSEKTIKELYEKDACFRQAIAFSSPSLFNQIQSGKANENSTLALMKYYSRMCSRCTPFGMFSVVTWGKTSEEVKTDIDLDQIVKRARPDMGWLQKLIDKICQNEDNFFDLEVQTNPLLYEQGDRYCISYFIDKFDQKAVTIRKSQLTSLVISSAKNSTKVRDLIQSISEHFPSVKTEKIIDALKTLVEQQFLWFSLFPNLSSASPFEDFLKKVPNSYLEVIEEIRKGIENYNKTGLNEGEFLLHDTANKMSSLVESLRYPVQVDLGLSSPQITLPINILNEVAEGAERLWCLGAIRPTESLMDKYQKKFLGKYGQQRRVPLYELLDPNSGLGMPNFDTKTTEMTTEKAEYRQFKEWLQYSLTTSLWNRDQEIIIDDNLINQWCKNVDLKKAPTSFDIFFELYAESAKAILDGDYLISVPNLVDVGGATFGRFIDVLDFELTSRIKDFYQSEESLEPDVEFIESSYLPKNSNAQNVGISPHFRTQSIDISPGGTSTLNLKNIFVGSTSEYLFLTDEKGEREYRVTTTNVLTKTQAPDVLRFVRDVSNMRYHPPEVWSWGTLGFTPYLPRIRYKKLVLSTAKWCMSLKNIGANPKDSITLISNRFEVFADKFFMPQYVFVTERDNKLLLDRKNSSHKKIIASYLKNSPWVLFTEKINGGGGHWISSQLGRHCIECVLPLVKNSSYVAKAPLPKRPFSEHSLDARWSFPGGEWFFAKIYLSLQGQDNFLLNHLKPFAQHLKDNNLITQWFFIRYKDERHHVRFRFKGHPETLYKEVLDLFHYWTKDLVSQNIVSDISICSYEREIERYGGVPLIHLCEDFFCTDSEVAIDLLKFQKQSQLPIYVIGALSILDLLKNLGLENDKLVLFFEYNKIDRTELNGIRDWRKLLSSTLGEQCGNFSEQRKKMLQLISNKIGELEEKKENSVSIYSLASSLVHMHCNRLAGIEGKIENKIRAYAGYSIQQPLPSKILTK